MKTEITIKYYKHMDNFEFEEEVSFVPFIGQIIVNESNRIKNCSNIFYISNISTVRSKDGYIISARADETNPQYLFDYDTEVGESLQHYYKGLSLSQPI